MREPRQGSALTAVRLARVDVDIMEKCACQLLQGSAKPTACILVNAEDASRMFASDELIEHLRYLDMDLMIKGIQILLVKQIGTRMRLAVM